MKKLIFLVVLAVVRCSGAFEPTPGGSASVAMGGAVAANRSEIWGGLLNPALLSGNESPTAGISYAPARFGIPELVRGDVFGLLPTSAGTLAISVSRFGFGPIHETDIGTRWGWSVFEDLALGATVHAYHLGISGYGSAWSAGIDLGGLLQITDQVAWGFVLMNATKAVIGASREVLPQLLISGIAYRPHSDLLLAADLVKDIRYPIAVRFGVEYHPLSALFLRVGSSLSPTLFTGGFGCIAGPIRFDYGYSHHPILGGSHQVSVLYSAE